VVSKTGDCQGVAAILDHLNNCVIERILVLLQPSSQVVRDSGGIVDNSKVSIGVWSWVSLCKVSPFSQKVRVKFLSKSLISSFWEKRFFLKDSQKSHGLFKHVNAFLQIHTKVHIGPVKTFPDIFLLFKSEHVLVKELLQLFVDIIDTNLFKTVIVENLEARDVEDTDVLDFLHSWVTEGFVTFFNYNTESTLIDGTSDTGDRTGSIGAGRSLRYPLSSYLQLWFAEVGDHPLTINSKELGNFLTIDVIFDLSLFLLADGNKILGEVTHVHHGSSVLEHIILFL